MSNAGGQSTVLQQPLVAGVELDGLVDESRLAPAHGLQDPVRLRSGQEAVVPPVLRPLAACALAAASPVVVLFCHTFENFNYFCKTKTEAGKPALSGLPFGPYLEYSISMLRSQILKTILSRILELRFFCFSYSLSSVSDSSAVTLSVTDTKIIYFLEKTNKKSR